MAHSTRTTYLAENTVGLLSANQFTNFLIPSPSSKKSLTGFQNCHDEAKNFMADYNVNMKQWNGTSFDNVLPLAYNAKQLGGQSLAEVKQWVQDNGLLLYTGQYTGTGTYGQSNPTTLQFPFEPILLFMPPDLQNSYNPSIPFPTNILGESYIGPFNLGSQYDIRIKMSADKKSILFYGSNQYKQFNVSGGTYYFAAIGGYDMGGTTEWTITSSTSIKVSKTGRYQLELYGHGGNGTRNQYGGASVASGGASCQVYDEISLLSGDTVNIVIDSERTSFGNYTVNAATSAHWDNSTSTITAGVGTGNKGANGTYSYASGSDWPNVYGTGTFSQKYGYGGGAEYRSYGTEGGPGAVYLKYLGA